VFAQERISLKDSILDSLIFYPIGNANIYNFDIKMHTFKIKGIKFDILEKKKDTVIYDLPDTYAEFKREFLDTKFKNNRGNLEIVYLTKEEIQEAKYSQNGLLGMIPGKAGQAIRSPITYLYNQFSRKMKMERLYQELVANQEEVYNLSNKYNQDLVASLTGLEGEELLNFMTYCKFSYYDLIRWTPEYIVLQIKKRYGDYEYYKAIEED
jgi:hypothetical protein